jgi:hypothetical protein
MNNIQKGVLLGVCLGLIVGALDFVHAQAVPAVGGPMPDNALESPSGHFKGVFVGIDVAVVYWDYDGDGIVDEVWVQWFGQIPGIIIIQPE